MGKKVSDIIGNIYNELTVIEYAGKVDKKGYCYKCKCNCGNFTYASRYYLEKNKLVSCGCKHHIKRITTDKHGENHDNWKGYKGILGTFYGAIRASAKNRNKIFSVSIEYLWELYEKQSGRCALTNVELYLAKTIKELYDENKQTASLDRINNSLGYIEDNVQWVHKDVNFIKSVLDQTEFIKLCKLITENMFVKESI